MMGNYENERNNLAEVKAGMPLHLYTDFEASKGEMSREEFQLKLKEIYCI